MQMRILAIGKVKEDFLREGISEYIKRLSGLAVELRIVELDEVKGDAGKCVREESKMILEKVQSPFVLCDLRGKNFTSEEFASHLEKLSTAQGRLDFVIGGSHGVDESVRNKANLNVAFGAMTFPHQLFRLLLCEQIYRSATIWHGKEYHK